jgi:alkanesulfonate monooxygenase SsuD/methylene tetrahydromethanopterin reductase-like flavin-dependent oxidoreductase (luciferase family)
MTIKLGTNLPEHLIATEPAALKDFLQAIEEMGYGYITVGDHVLGADVSVRPDWKPFFGQAPLYDHHMSWHEPMASCRAAAPASSSRRAGTTSSSRAWGSTSASAARSWTSSSKC